MKKLLFISAAIISIASCNTTPQSTCNPTTAKIIDDVLEIYKNDTTYVVDVVNHTITTIYKCGDYTRTTVNDFN